MIGRRGIALLAGAVLGLSLAACASDGEKNVDIVGVGPNTITVPAGRFVMGSSAEQREYAYQLDEIAQGNPRSRAQQIYAGELDPVWEEVPAYEIMRTPVTNAQYAEFVEATGHPAPDVDRETWLSYRLRLPFEETRRFAWTDGAPPEGRGDHPVVLVDYEDVQAFAAWLSAETGRT